MNEQLAEKIIELLKDIKEELGEIRFRLNSVKEYSDSLDNNTIKINNKLNELIHVVKSKN